MESVDGLYTISFKGLKPGSHVFDWTVDAAFFAQYEMSEISDANIAVQLTLVKHTDFLELDFAFSGWAEVMCDRCLDQLRIDIASGARMYVRFDDRADDDMQNDDDVVTLSRSEDRLNVAQYIYEYAHLSLPVRRVHAGDANGRSGCNAGMISKLEQYLVEHSES